MAKNLQIVPNIFSPEQAKELAKNMFLSMAVGRYDKIAQYTGIPKSQIVEWSAEGNWAALRRSKKEQLQIAIDSEIGDAKKCRIRALKAIEMLEIDLEKRTIELCGQRQWAPRTQKMLIEMWKQLLETRERLEKRLGVG